jgi:alpha-tubulin suppressor-like RCC1 family protein
MVIDGGQVLAWGSNTKGQLGETSASFLNTPTRIPSLENIIALAQGSAANHSLALREDGSVWAWGSNKAGQLGIGNADVSHLTIPKMIEGVYGIVALAVGRNHSVALKDDGSVWTWGDNSYGQLGLYNQKTSLTPVKVEGLSDIVSVVAGYHHTLALRKDGTVWAWGKNINGQLGNGTNETNHIPSQVQNLTNVVYISSGAAHCMALKGDGTVWAWGWNDYGQLGNGNFQSLNLPTQLPVGNIVKIAAGGLHTIALTTQGTVYAWGANTFGQLGKSSNRNFSKPVKVFSIKNAISIVAGDMHSLAVDTKGNVHSWGSNSNYQLGLTEDLSSSTALNVYQIKEDAPLALTALNNQTPSIIPIPNKYEPINEALVEKDLNINTKGNVTKGANDDNNQTYTDEIKSDGFAIPESFGSNDEVECLIEATLRNINLSAIRTSKEKSILLRWEAPLDITSLDFVIEKSINNQTWIEMDVLPNIKEKKNYYLLTAVDEAASNMNVYYRLRQVNCSEEFKYSVTTFMNIKAKTKAMFEAGPELAKDYFILAVNKRIEKGYKYELIDSDDRAIISGKIPANEFKQSISISIRAIRDGLYTFRIVKGKKIIFKEKIFKIEE